MTTYSNYSCTRIPVDGPPTRVRVSGSLLALLTYEYPGGYGLSHCISEIFIKRPFSLLTGITFRLRVNLSFCYAKFVANWTNTTDYWSKHYSYGSKTSLILHCCSLVSRSAKRYVSNHRESGETRKTSCLLHNSCSITSSVSVPHSKKKTARVVDKPIQPYC